MYTLRKKGRKNGENIFVDACVATECFWKDIQKGDEAADRAG